MKYIEKWLHRASSAGGCFFLLKIIIFHEKLTELRMTAKQYAFDNNWYYYIKIFSRNKKTIKI